MLNSSSNQETNVKPRMTLLSNKSRKECALMKSQQEEAEEFEKTMDEILEKLSVIQDKIKRDPGLYNEEFNKILECFKVLFADFLETPNKKIKGIKELILFFAQVSHIYPKSVSFIPFKLINLIENNYAIISPDIRFGIVEALSLLRKKDLLEAVEILPLFFKLLKCQDKELRKKLHDIIISDMTRINKSHKNNVINKKIQNFCFEMLKDPNKKAARKTLNIMIVLYKKKIWNDAKTVNSISQGCMSMDLKLVYATCKFFLSEYQEEEPESDDESLDDLKNKYKLMGKGNTKKTKGRKNKLKRLIKQIDRKDKRTSKVKTSSDFMPIDVLNDPFTFAEKLFSKLKSIKEKFQIKLIVMRLLGRVIGRHKLIIVNYFSYLLNYITPQQKELASIFTSVIEGCHELVPASELESVINKLFDGFISECLPPPNITIGLNTLREILERTPHAITDKHLIDQVETMRSFKNKSVATAARGFINLIKEINPALLDIYDKDAKQKISFYGQSTMSSGIDGIDLLKKYEKIPDEYNLEYHEILDNLQHRKIKLLKMRQAAEKIQNRKVDLTDVDVDKMLGVHVNTTNKKSMKKPKLFKEDEKKVDEEMEEEMEDDDEMLELEDMGEGEEMEDDEEMEEDSDSDDEEEFKGYNDKVKEGKKGDVEIDEDEENKSFNDDDLDELDLDQNEEVEELEDGEGESILRLESDELKSDRSDFESDSENNVHGFIDPGKLLSYRKTYKEKADQLKFNHEKEKFKRTRKAKGGGTTNKEKLKSKPVMMIISKKRRQVKEKIITMNKKIKSIKKQQMGRFKQGSMVLKKKGPK